MAKKPAECEEVPDESWMATFADAITLLMAFFVMLLTFVEYDIPAFDEAAEAIAERVGGDGPPSPAKMLKEDVQMMVDEMEAEGDVTVSKDARGLMIELSGGAFFLPGTATLREKALPILKKMTESLNAPEYRCFNIKVEGHTDNIPIQTKKFPSNWELSAARASRVTRFFITEKLQDFRFKTVAFADTQPKAPNLGEDGQAIKENQAKNQRIQMKVERMSLDEQKKCNEADNLKDMLQNVGGNS